MSSMKTLFSIKLVSAEEVFKAINVTKKQLWLITVSNRNFQKMYKKVLFPKKSCLTTNWSIISYFKTFQKKSNYLKRRFY